MSSDKQGRHVVARVCVEDATVLMRIVEQRGIERCCGRIPVEGAPLIVRSGDRGPYLADNTLGLWGDWTWEDDDVVRISFMSQSEARKYAAKLVRTINLINCARVPCKKCGRPGVLVEYLTPWVVMCRDMYCSNIAFDGTTPAEAWAKWGKANRGAVDFPEGTFVTIGDQDD